MVTSSEKWKIIERDKSTNLFNQGPVSQQVWHNKDPSLLKDPEFYSPLPEMVASPYKW
jgi:hypothetical protein